jgi:hypothetical protein
MVGRDLDFFISVLQVSFDFESGIQGSEVTTLQHHYFSGNLHFNQYDLTSFGQCIIVTPKRFVGHSVGWWRGCTILSNSMTQHVP